MSETWLVGLVVVGWLCGCSEGGGAPKRNEPANQGGDGGKAEGGEGGKAEGGEGGKGSDDLSSVCPEVREEVTEDGFAVVRCLALFDDEPLVIRLPAARPQTAYAAFAEDGFETADGKRYEVEIEEGRPPWVAEEQRVGSALYRIHLDADEVTAFEPVIVFDEAIFLKPFGTGALEGAISRRVVAEPPTYDVEPSLPLRATVALDAQKGQLTLTITNATQSESATDGSCLPALGDAGEANPFEGAENPRLVGYRVASMHGLGDDHMIFDAEDPLTFGVMGSAWYLGPLNVLRSDLSLPTEYTGFVHGAPGSEPSITLRQATGGGEPCTP